MFAAATACLRPYTPTYVGDVDNTYLASAYCYIFFLIQLYTATYICVLILLYMCALSLTGANSNGLRVLARAAAAVVEGPSRMLPGHKLLVYQALGD